MKRFLLIFTLTICLLFHSNLIADAVQNNKNLIGHGGPVNTVAISPDGKTALSGSLDYAVMLWDLDTANTKPVKQSHRFIAHKGAVSAVKFFPLARKQSRQVIMEMFMFGTCLIKKSLPN